jgi:Trypsin-like peptidase domain
VFANTVADNRESIYAILSSSPLPPRAITPAVGSAFMLAPGFLVTAAHCLDDPSKPGSPPYESLSVIRAPDIGRKPSPAAVVARDDARDLALLRVDSPSSSACLRLVGAEVPVGTRCGTSGFPRIVVDVAPGRGVSLIELFQGGEITAYVPGTDADPGGRYETDSPVYGDASGCPGFLASGEVFGMYRQFVPAVAIDGGSGAAGEATRAGTSVWVPSMEIVAFARAHGVPLPI